MALPRITQGQAQGVISNARLNGAAVQLTTGSRPPAVQKALLGRMKELDARQARRNDRNKATVLKELVPLKT